MIINVDKQGLNTILAALRFYQANDQGNPNSRSDDIHDIATNGEQDTSLDASGIDILAYMINTTSPQVYVIRNKFNHEDWWNNETGWGSCAGADLFDGTERLTLDAPVDGIWCALEDLGIEVDRLNREVYGLKIDIKGWEDSA